MTAAQLTMLLLIGGLGAYVLTPTTSNYMMERWEQEDSRGCAAAAVVVLMMLTYAFWDIP